MTLQEEFSYALKNDSADGKQFARYVYQKCCEYMGSDHEGESVKILTAAFQAIRAEGRCGNKQ